MKTYVVDYAFTDLFKVEIDDEALPVITEMVQFWAGWEDKVEDANGDYVKVWLKQLARFMINEGRLPRMVDSQWTSDLDEGWASSPHIRIISSGYFEPDDQDITILEVDNAEAKT